ncbi:MAG: iron export ABC transporter permease subunit FetB [Halothiobacillus sp. 20-53-49]|nr:iron export ABC transporter permease subunit FetB [Halothiobacillaceae bacterium]OYV45776.1 MAG: iron export ABC transporter permease subunit FetB [Halothiobacillus sp. 20-53-49]HUN00314.1 iron export ABC transporter permease subunit FetB [Halothiobacillus sp.]
MNLEQLSVIDLSLAALLVAALGLVQLIMGLGLLRALLMGSVRMTLQLLLVGLVLKSLFEAANLGWVSLMALIMLALAGYEVTARQKRPIKGWHGYTIGLLSMGVTAATITLFALIIIIEPHPWYTPQYAIPLLGMILGNTMTGIGLALNHLTQTAWSARVKIEARLLLGQTAGEATAELRADALRAGLIPTLNMLAAAGLISLPGMMTGQILAGAAPMDAVRYQILIMFLITAANGFGSLLAVHLGTRRLFDERARLRLDRLTTRKA